MSDPKTTADQVLTEYRAAQAIAFEAGRVAPDTYHHGFECGYREGLRRALTLLTGIPVND